MSFEEKMADRIVWMLNDLLSSDREAIESLMAMSVPVNEKIANHKTAPVRLDDDGNPHLRTLGLLNSFFTEGPKVCAVYDDDGKLSHFKIVGDKNA